MSKELARVMDTPSGPEVLRAIGGRGYFKGLGLGRRFEAAASHRFAEYLPPVFSFENREDYYAREFDGFGAHFGVAPSFIDPNSGESAPFVTSEHIQTVTELLLKEFEPVLYAIELVTFREEAELSPEQATFMSGDRLPGFSLVPVPR